MKYFNKLSAKLATVSFALITAGLFMFGGTASADSSCLYQYNSTGNFTTSATPVFNSICGVPTLGNEPDFVRIRQSATNTTNPSATQDEATLPAYSTSNINSDCTAGEEFDVWNYLHNNAYSQDNDNGSGSAVAHGVTGDLSVPLGTASKSFNFGYTVSASNAATVSDSINLNCSNDVTLTLVPGSIHVLTSPTGSWQDLIPESTSSLNTPISLGNPVWGSGDEWGCWNYRILIIYEVEVTPVTPTQTPPVCSALNTASNDVADIESVNYKANSATVTGITLDLYKNSASGTPVTSVTIAPNGSHTFDTSGLTANTKYVIVANVLYTLNKTSSSVTSPNCEVAFTTPSSTTPPSTPPQQIVTTAVTTSSLPNTGPNTATMVGIFAGISALGTGAYRWALKRHLAR